MERELPAEFADAMRRILGEEEYREFISSYDAPRRNGLRVNTLKISPREFQAMAPFHLTPVPWAPDGFYYEREDLPSRHPYYRAGLYYLQEPSAMAPAAVLPIRPGDRVLDLCAAPGGKSTELGAQLRGDGLLLANEISASRVRALLRNIELFGISNACVTNAVPARLLERYPLYFDRILVDAPCSGEGMFRKDEDVMRAWYPGKVEECAKIQRSIAVQAADMLRPGGLMLYSTCTFAPEEDELVIAHLLHERPEMELVEIPRTPGREGFSEGLSAVYLKACGYEPEGRTVGSLRRETVLPGEEQTVGSLRRETVFPDGEQTDDRLQEGAFLPGEEQVARRAGDADLSRTVRLWPHKIDGEGHFLALLRKKTGEELVPESPAGGRIAGGPGPAEIRDRAADPRAAGRGSVSDGRRETGKKKVRQGKAAGHESDREIREAAGLVRSFSAQLDPDLLKKKEEEGHAIEIHSGQAYLTGKGMAPASGIACLRSGLYLGEVRKNRFEPAQEYALAMPRMGGGMDEVLTADSMQGMQSSGTKKDTGDHGDASPVLSLRPEDERLARYFRGESIPLGDSEAPGDGWKLVCVDGFPAGWGKRTGNVLKNKYPAGWRAR